MDLPDVNVLVAAYRADAPGHRHASAWLAAAMSASTPFGISELALSAAIRILSHPGASRFPPDKEHVISFARTVHAHPNSVLIRPGDRHFTIFLELCGPQGIHCKVIPDAYYAAIAIESECEFVTSDRGFDRFPGLRWRLLT